MGGIFDLDGPLTRALNGFADIIVLSLCWVLGCVPIVTIGASTTALYYAAMKAARADGTVAKNFWKSYRENLGQAVIVELILVLAGVVLYLLYQTAYSVEGGFSSILKLVFQAVFLLYLVLLSYVFPLLSRFVQTVPVLFRNALIMSLGHFPQTILIVVIHLAPVLIIFLRIDWFFMALPLLVALVPGMVATLNGPIFARMFRQYTPQEILDQEEEATKDRGTFYTEE